MVPGHVRLLRFGSESTESLGAAPAPAVERVESHLLRKVRPERGDPALEFTS
jgi:hypothetical protein